jgi:acyl-CoA synthetase (AMP-forming)/AMP-acid ligase II
LKVSKRFWKEFKLGNDRNISFRYSFKITTKAYPFIRKRKLDIRAKQGIAFPGVEIRIMTDEGTLAPTDGKSMGELQIKGHGLSTFKTRIALQMTDGLKPVM